MGSRAAAVQERVGEFEEPTDGYVLLDAGVDWTRIAGSFLQGGLPRVENATD